MPKTKLYIPTVNLNVESSLRIGNVTVHPAKEADVITRYFSDESATKDIHEYLGKNAFVEIEVEREEGAKLLPKDLTAVEHAIRESMSILYLMQKEIAGQYSVKDQIFGLASETPSFLNFIVGIEEGKTSYGFRRGGNYAEWTFNNSSLREIQERKDFQFLSRVAASNNRTDMENRVMKSIGLIYEGALELKPQYRFTKIMTGFEVLLLKEGGKEQKAFTLAKNCTMLSHAFLYPQHKCLCPVLDAENAEDYSERVKASGLPGICSAYREFKKWYAIRNDVTHEANLKEVNDHFSSFEWWAHQYFMKIIEIVAENPKMELSGLRQYIKDRYQSWRSSFSVK